MTLSVTTLLVLTVALATSALATATGVTVLNDDNFSYLTSGKVVFIKFFVPWCGYCKQIAPAWEQLANEYNVGNQNKKNSIMIAEVDCTKDDSKRICEDSEVEHYPTLKYGDPFALEDYIGEGRDYESFAAFVKDNLKSSCSPFHLEECSDEQKTEIIQLQSLSEEELNEKVAEVEAKIMIADEKMQTDLSNVEYMYDTITQAFTDEFEAMNKESNLRTKADEKVQTELSYLEDMYDTITQAFTDEVKAIKMESNLIKTVLAASKDKIGDGKPIGDEF